MAEISAMIPLGTKAPSFHLQDMRTNHWIDLNDLHVEHALVIMFICNHCPYVKHIIPKLIEITRAYQQKGILFIAINSNDADTYPDDSPARMKQLAQEKDFTFPYLHDETQAIAKAYHAVCTPDFFIFDRTLSCIYRGRFDDSTPKNNLPVSGADLVHALDQLLTGSPISNDQKPSMGCSIKWK